LSRSCASDDEGRRRFLGAGAVVVSDTAEDGVYVGVPARRQSGITALQQTG
jgi:acetyltransferase-like isoleucine patch superfamily enzyme